MSRPARDTVVNIHVRKVKIIINLTEDYFGPTLEDLSRFHRKALHFL